MYLMDVNCPSKCTKHQQNGEQVLHISLLDADKGNGKALKFSTRQETNISILDLVEFYGAA